MSIFPKSSFLVLNQEFMNPKQHIYAKKKKDEARRSLRTGLIFLITVDLMVATAFLSTTIADIYKMSNEEVIGGTVSNFITSFVQAGSFVYFFKETNDSVQIGLNVFRIANALRLCSCIYEVYYLVHSSEFAKLTTRFPWIFLSTASLKVILSIASLLFDVFILVKFKNSVQEYPGGK